MKPNASQQDNDSDAGPKVGGANQYDVALLIARSFGKLLPWISLVLIGLGLAWFLIRELRSLNAELVVLKVQAVQAEAAASAAGDRAKLVTIQADAAASAAADRAKIEVLNNTSQQLLSIQETSIAVSKKLQELVAGQVRNITDTEALAQKQTAQQRRENEEQAKALKEDIEKLKEEKSRAAKDAILAGYEEFKGAISQSMNRQFSLDDTASMMLRTRARSEVFLESLRADIDRRAFSAVMSAAIAAELYCQGGDDRDFGRIIKIINESTAKLDGTWGQVFRYRQDMQEAARERMFEYAITLAAEPKTNQQFRLVVAQAATSYGRRNSQGILPMDEPKRLSIIELLRSVFNTEMSPTQAYCANTPYTMMMYSQDATNVYTYQALQLPDATDAAKKCLTTFREQYKLPQPSQSTIQTWSK